MASRGHIVVLHGSIKADAGKDEEDTIVQANEVNRSLARLGYTTEICITNLDLDSLRASLLVKKPSAVFYLVEAIDGIGRYIHLPAAILEETGIPFTGCDSETLVITSSKTLTKSLLEAHKLPTPAWFNLAEALKQKETLPFPLIIKHRTEHASYGMDHASVVFSANELKNAVSRMTKTEIESNFLESYIDGREFNISVIQTDNGPVVLPYAEILFDAYDTNRVRIVDYKAKWDDSSFEYSNTPRTFTFSSEDNTLLEKLKRISISTWNLFNLAGYARIDYRVDKESNPFILEINANPCISKDSGFVAAAEKGGYTFDKLIDTLLSAARNKAWNK